MRAKDTSEESTSRPRKKRKRLRRILGLAMIGSAIMKFRQHKDNPT